MKFICLYFPGGVEEGESAFYLLTITFIFSTGFQVFRSSMNAPLWMIEYDRMIDELPVMIIQSTIADNLQTTPLHKEDNLKCDGFFYGNSALSFTLRLFASFRLRQRN